MPQDLRAVATVPVVVRADELKWTDGPSSLPKGATMAVLEGDPGKPAPFTIRFRLPDGYRIPAHFHPADEHVTVVSGTFLFGMGDTFDASATTRLGPGAYVLMPKGHHHFATVRGDTILQVNGIGPWGIIYLNPADDPRARREAQK